MESSSAEAHAKSFGMGLLAHLVLIPSWTAAPPALLGCCLAAGRPHGWRGLAGGLGVCGGLAASSSASQRVPLCLMLIGMSAAAPSSRALAIVSASIASVLSWMCGGGDFARRPGLVRFIIKWKADYYAQAEVRGDLKKIRTEKSLFCFHPHGILCGGYSINGVWNDELLKHTGKVSWLIDASLREKSPFFRWLCDALKSEDREVLSADKKSFRDCMAKGKNMAVVPGGMREAILYRRGRDRVDLTRRKGFIKYALQFGYRLHPVWTFGECETYSALCGLDHLRLWFADRNFPMVAFFGWPLFPLLPRPQAKLITYIGPGLDLPRIPEPTQSDVDTWHAEYVKELRRLYTDKRHEVGYAQSELQIL